MSFFKIASADATSTKEAMQQTPEAGPTGELDDLIIGAGMAGLTVGALLARQGRRVLLLEAHDTPGGYAHTFTLGRYRFCAQVHYIFHCGEGEPVAQLLERLGLDQEVRFHRLDPEGFDHIVVAGQRYRIPSGLGKFRDRLLRRFPGDALALHGYFDTISALGRELDVLPRPIRWHDWLTAPLRFPSLLRYQSHTLQRLYDELRLPPRLQTILAGQCGDYLLPPAEVSLLLHVALVRAYDRGAYYPEQHFQHFIGSLASFINKQPGCMLRLRSQVERILTANGRVVGVRTGDGQTYTARRYISNVDPRRTLELAGQQAFPPGYQKSLQYEYSCGTLNLYLGVRGLDLRQHGFGSFNVWHYPSDDINAIYKRQNQAHDFSEPWLFMSTPTLHTGAPGLCPPGEQILEIVTSADYGHFKQLRDRNRRQYNQEKQRLRDHILQLVEQRYVPELRRHLVLRVMGTPATSERFCGAPQGNAYGSALTPKNVRTRVPYATPLPNLWLVGATAGHPSIGGTVMAGLELAEQLS